MSVVSWVNWVSLSPQPSKLSSKPLSTETLPVPKEKSGLYFWDLENWSLCGVPVWWRLLVDL